MNHYESGSDDDERENQRMRRRGREVFEDLEAEEPVHQRRRTDDEPKLSFALPSDYPKADLISGEINDHNINELVHLYLSDKSKLPESLKNKPIGKWDVSNVTDMFGLFSMPSDNTKEEYPAGAFNEDISEWMVHNVTNMGHMFSSNQHFDQDISSWDVGNVTSMESMFSYTLFNQDIGGWDVSKVLNMNSM